MKKGIFVLGVLFAFACVFNFHIFKKGKHLQYSDIALLNVEAIASGEGGGVGETTCYSWIVEKEGGLVVACSDCTIRYGYVAGAPGIQDSGKCTMTN